jgi:hypothetical protein
MKLLLEFSENCVCLHNTLVLPGELREKEIKIIKFRVGNNGEVNLEIWVAFT